MQTDNGIMLPSLLNRELDKEFMSMEYWLPAV